MHAKTPPLEYAVLTKIVLGLQIADQLADLIHGIAEPRDNLRGSIPLIKSNLGRLFHVIDVFVESTICIVTLLFHRGAELHKIFGNWLIRGFEDIDQPVYVISADSRLKRKGTHAPESPLSCSVKSVMARPSLPARPVLPIL